IHPQWDDIGSKTLYLKVLYADYDANFAIIEFIGEWNDAVENDVMLLKRKLIDVMIEKGIYKYVMIAENILNFHSSDDSYYEEWKEDIESEGGWITFLNLPPYSSEDIYQAKLNRYLFLMDYPNWRNHQPQHLFQFID